MIEIPKNYTADLLFCSAIFRRNWLLYSIKIRIKRAKQGMFRVDQRVHHESSTPLSTVEVMVCVVSLCSGLMGVK